MNYIFDPEIDAKWDGIEITDVEHGHRMIYHCTDGIKIDYGPYDKKIYDQMVDDHIDHKFPFLKEPLTVKNMNIDGAVMLLAQLMKSVKIAYITQARDLKRHYCQVPTSMEEFEELVKEAPNKEVKSLLWHISGTIKFMEDGAAGAIDGLKGNIDAQGIMRVWKEEALGHGRVKTGHPSYSRGRRLPTTEGYNSNS